MRIFLSYSTPDHTAAEAVRLGLLARRPALDIYFAPQRNDAGAYWIPRLAAELRGADTLLLVLGRRVGPWQELEYYEALRQNRDGGRPLIVPVLLADTAPGLPFLDQFHRLVAGPDGDLLTAQVLRALDGAAVDDAAPAWRLVNPYRGLRAMETADAAYFFGRERLTAHILTGLAREPGRIQALIGNSGVGKSSVAMAGVLAALRGRLWPGVAGEEWPTALVDSPSWPTLVVRPGHRPVLALARACASLWLDSPARIEAEALRWHGLLMGASALDPLIDASVEQVGRRAGADPPPRVALYVDQAEELYTRADPEEARRFSALMAEAAVSAKVAALLSLRSDHYGRFQADAKLFGCATTTDVTPLGRDAIEQIVRRPAEQLGVRFDPPEMAGHIADATAREPGALPLLSDLLADAWQAMADDPRADGRMRLPSQLVDIGRPLADKAERFLSAHVAHENDLRRLLTLKLALVPKAGDVVRRRARRSECSEAEWALVDALAGRDWRLLTIGEDAGEAVAEVAHEALLRHWPRAASWLDDSRDFLLWKGRFEAECRDWASAPDADRERALLTGLRLEAAVRWRLERPDDLGDEELDFIESSLRAAEGRRRREQEAADRLTRQRRWIQRLSAAALVTVTAVAAVAMWQSHKAGLAETDALAERQRAVDALDEARRQADLANARRLAIAAEAALDTEVGGTTLAGLLATASLRRSATPEGQRVLRRVMGLLPRHAVPIETPWRGADVHLARDGRVAAFTRLRGDSGSSDKPATGSVVVVDAATWRPRALHDQAGRVWPALSADGRWLAVVGHGRRVQVIDQNTGRRVLDEHQDDMVDAVFDARGERLFVARTDGVVEVRTAPAWQPTARLSFPVDGARRETVRIARAPDGPRLLVYGQTADAGSLNPWLLPMDGGEPVALGQDRAVSARFAPTGDVVLTVSWRGEIAAWDAVTGQPIWSLPTDDRVYDLAVAPDGRLLAAAMRSGEVWLVDTGTGGRNRTLTHDNGVNAVAFSPDGTRLATASDDHSAALWRIATGEREHTLPHDDEVWAVAFGPDGSVLTGSRDGVLRTFDGDVGQLQQQLTVDSGIRSISWSAGMQNVVVALQGTDQAQAWMDIQLVDPNSGEAGARIEHNGRLARLRFSPDARTLATVGAGTGALKLWDATNGRLRAEPGVAAGDLHFSADGRRLLVGGGGRETVLIDSDDGRRVASIGESGGVAAVAVAPDGRTAVSFGQDGHFRAWDLIDGTPMWSRQAPRPDTHFIMLSQDGRRFADRGPDDRTVEVRDTRTGILLLRVRADPPLAYDLSADGGSLMLVRTGIPGPRRADPPDSELQLWRVDTGQRVMRRRLGVRHARVEAVDEVFIVATVPDGDVQGRVEALDTRSGQVRWSVPMGRSFPTVQLPAGDSGWVALRAGQASAMRRAGDGDAPLPDDASLLAVLPGDVVVAHGSDGVEVRAAAGGTVQRRIADVTDLDGVAVAADDRRVWAWGRRSGVPGAWTWRQGDAAPARFLAMDHRVRSLEPLADPDLAVIHDHAGTLTVWRASADQAIHRLSHTSTADGVATAIAADRAVTWQGRSVRMWRMHDGAALAQRQAPDTIERLAVSPDGRTVAYVSRRTAAGRGGDAVYALELWRPDGDDEPDVLPVASTGALTFGPAGRYLAVRRGANALQLIDLATLQPRDLALALPDGRLGEPVFSADGTLLMVTESRRQTSHVRVFELPSGQEIARIDGRLQGSMQALPDARRLPVLDAEWRWRAADVRSATPDATWRPGTDVGLAFEHGARKLRVSAPEPEGIDLPGELRDSTVVAPVLEGRPLNVWEVDPEGDHLAVVTDAGVSVHAGDDGRRLADWPGMRLRGAGVGVGPHLRPVRGLRFADGGRALVAFDADRLGQPDATGGLWWWHWSEGVPTVLSEGVPINGIDVSPDGRLLASAEGHDDRERGTDRARQVREARVRLWDARRGEELLRLPMDEVVDAVAFSPDGTRLAVRTVSEIVVVHTQDGSPVRQMRFEGLRTTAGSVRFALNGRAVVAEVAGGVQVWALDSSGDRLLRHGTDHPHYRLSARGDVLASFDRKRLRVWDVATGERRFGMQLPETGGLDLAFLGPDDALWARSRQGLSRLLWRTERLIEDACRRLTRDLSVDEIEQHLSPGSQSQVCPSARR